MEVNYTKDVQLLFLRFLLSDPSLYVRINNIYNPENFDKSLKKAAEFIKTHAQEHQTLPDITQISAVTGVKIETLSDINSGHIDWFMETFESFTRRQEIERAIIKASELLEKGDYGPVEKLIKDAVQISLTRDLGTDYFEDPRTRLTKLRSENGQISTGWSQLDQALYGGFRRKELEIVCGNSGSGKSLVLQNLAANWILNNLSGIYVTLELSEELCAMRIDSMMVRMNTRDLFHSLDDVELKLRMMSKKSGNLKLKYLPAQSTVNDIRAYVKELSIKQNFRPDFICVDYLDLMSPASVKVSASDMFIKDKFVSEELRNLAHELDIVLMSASQFNRSGVEEVEFDHSNISGGISKIYTADNVFGIFTSRAMRERGKYQLQLMKTRNSGGVGKKIDLDFDINCLKISDPGVQDKPVTNTQSVMDKIRTASSMKKPEPTEDIDTAGTPQIQSNKLKNMLANLRKTQE